ncbi:MAG: hypothetical protein K2X90_04595 [Candidatus Babeliaceae bacterium]|nr:hypothetical protein [Candidatus Babeliaceae bacterium]
MTKNFLSIVFLVSALVMLPGCDWDWKSWFTQSCTTCVGGHGHDHGKGGSACCISLDGKPALTQRDFENKFNQLCMARPDIQQALAGLPAEQQQAFYDQFADAMLAELLVSHYVKEAGLMETSEYKMAAQQAHDAVETQLKNSIFQSDIFKKIEREVTDEVAQKYYEENRDRVAIFKRAPFIDKIGGVSVQMIEVPKETEAKSLAAQVQKQDIAKVARDAQRKVKNLGLVTPRSMEVDEHIRSKVMGYTTVPQAEVVKLTNGKYAVIKATAIEKDSFKPFNEPEVKEAVKSFLIRNELGKAVTKTMDELKQKYGAIIHRDNIMQLVKIDSQTATIQEESLQEKAPMAKALKA